MNVPKWCTPPAKSPGDGTEAGRRLSQSWSARAAPTLNRLFDGVLIFVSALSQQGTSVTKERSSTATRIAVCTLAVFGFMIFQFYSGSIVSSIFDTKHESIKTVRDLTDSHLRIGLQDVIYDKYLWRHVNDPEIQRLFHKKIEFYNETSRSLDYHFYPPEQGMEMVRTQPFGFNVEEAIGYRIIGETFDERLICKLSEIEVTRAHNLVGAVRKDSPFRELYTYGTWRLKEAGIVDRWRRIFHLPKPKCVRDLQTSDFTVDMTAIYSLLILLSGGFTLSFVTLIVEIWIFQRTKTGEKKEAEASRSQQPQPHGVSRRKKEEATTGVYLE